MYQEPIVDFVYPDEEDNNIQNAYREASLHLQGVLDLVMAEIAAASNKELAIWAVSYALGLAVCEGVSITDRAVELDVSPQALSKHIKKVEYQLNLNTSNYTYKKCK